MQLWNWATFYCAAKTDAIIFDANFGLQLTEDFTKLKIKTIFF